MGKGFDQNQERIAALQALGKDLARRAKSKCELTGVGGVPLRAYEIPPVSKDPEIERTLLLSESCHEALNRPSLLDGRRWQCLAEMIWSEQPAVQVVAWRMLQQLAKKEDWAREALDGALLEPETEEWARAASL